MGSPDMEVRDDGTLVVEAPTVESALAAVQSHCGPNATIVEAEKVQSKGIGGFFSKQMYRVHVAPTVDADRGSGRSVPPTRDPGSIGTDPSVGEAVDVVLRQVEAGEHSGSQTFGEALQAQLGSAESDDLLSNGATDAMIDLRDDFDFGSGIEPLDLPQAPLVAPTLEDIVAMRTVEQVVPEPPSSSPTVSRVDQTRVPLGRPADEWVPGAGPVCWSVDQLSRIGLPYRLISELADLDPTDDLAWVFRLAESASPLCGAVPDEAMMMVGRNLDATSSRMGLECVEFPEPPPYVGDVGLTMTSFAEGSEFVDKVRAGRPLHLVCDDAGFGVELLDSSQSLSSVAVVSTTRGALALALQIVVATGGVLGYLIDGDEIIRITPFELALAVRAQLPRE